MLFRCLCEDRVVGLRLHAVLADVHGIMTGRAQPLSDPWRNRIVDEKSHGAVSGSSRSRTASAAERNAS